MKISDWLSSAGRKFTVALAALALAACGAVARVPEAIEAARDVATVAEPCLVAEQSREYNACPLGPAGDSCRAAVVTQWAPVKSAFERLHALWCEVSPSSEGCP